MKATLKALKDKYFDYSMLRWSLVGVTTTAIDYFLFISLYGPINSIFLANLISASVATSINYLAQHPGRVFSRSQLLQEIWGYDYFGGTRTVDVHIRRLRSKLGPEFESIIDTVRNVGYRFAVTASNNESVNIKL